MKQDVNEIEDYAYAECIRPLASGDAELQHVIRMHPIEVV